MNTTLRKTIKDIDSRFFAGVLRKLTLKYKKLIYTNKMNSIFKYNNNICITSKKQNNLGKLFDKYGSDKGYYLHKKDQYYLAGNGYNDIYEMLFFQHKNNTKLVIECGIGSKNPETPSNMSLYKHSIPGGSLRAWRDYFPNAQVVGIDIDPDVMFTEERIDTYLCDQTSKLSIDSFIVQAELKPNIVDIIIDDGLHEFDANIKLFENTRNLLKDNGIYIIEDFWIINKTQQGFIDYFKNLSGYNVIFIKNKLAYLIVITKRN